jgi:dipeptidase D
MLTDMERTSDRRLAADRRDRRHGTLAQALLLAAAALLGAAALTACGSSPSATAGPSTPPPGQSSAGPGPALTPLAEALASLEPSAVWRHFYALTQIPRPSGREEKAAACITSWAKERGFKASIDKAGNVLVRVPASAGHETAPGVVLQGHLDMVAAQASTATVDPATDPLLPVVEGGWVRAQGTSLGADDGIGVAMALAVLEDKTVAHGPVELLFTVGEEIGLVGANALAPGVLTGRMLINVDDGVADELTISSAGAAVGEVAETYEQQPVPAGMAGLTVTVDGLRGGHSGDDINKGRGSAHELIARLLTEAPAEYGVRVARVDGCTVENAIPNKAVALVALPTSQVDAFTAYVAGFGERVAAELAEGDPDVAVTAKPEELPGRVMAPQAQRALLEAVRDAPQGVYRMSADVPGLVETSGNLGGLTIGEGHFSAIFMVRSAVNAERDAEAQRFTDVFEKAGATVTITKEYPSWPPNPDSSLLALLTTAFVDITGAQPVVAAVHAGIETGTIGSKYPGLDMVSLGPTIVGGHSPEERLDVASVARTYAVLAAAVQRIGEQRTE